MSRSLADHFFVSWKLVCLKKVHARLQLQYQASDSPDFDQLKFSRVM
jgi:hypothetical protein